MPRHLVVPNIQYRVTEEEVDELLASVDEVAAWIDTKAAEQAALNLWEDPVFTLAQLDRKIKDIEREVCPFP